MIGNDGYGTHCEVGQWDENGIPTNATMVLSSVIPYYIPNATNVFEHLEYTNWWEVSTDYGAGLMNATKAWKRATTDNNQDLFSVLTHELVHGCLGFGTDTPYYCQTIASDLHIHVTEGPYAGASVPVNPLTGNHMHLASPDAGALLMCGIPTGGLRLLLSNVDAAAISTACRLPNARYDDQPIVTNAPPDYIKDPNVAPMRRRQDSI